MLSGAVRSFKERQKSTIELGLMGTKPVPWIESDQASGIIGFLIFTNCIVIAIETDVEANFGDSFRMLFLVVECIYIVLFSLEIAIRFYGQRLHFFYDAWNWFDVIIVGIGVMNVGLEVL